MKPAWYKQCRWGGRVPAPGYNQPQHSFLTCAQWCQIIPKSYPVIQGWFVVWFSIEIFGWKGWLVPDSGVPEAIFGCKQTIPDSGVPEARGPAGFDSGITAATAVTAPLSTHLVDQAASTLSRPVSSLQQIQCFQLLSSVAWGWVDIQWLGGHYYLVPTCLNCYLPLAWPYTDTLPVVGSIYVESIRYIGPLIITLKICKILDTRF